MKKAAIAAALIFFSIHGYAVQTRSPALQLQYAVIVSRHGVRAPTWTPDRLNTYSIEPWPDFGVEPGYLTAHGRALMEIMGGFYREYLVSEKLFGAPNCADAGHTYFWADTDQRTLETARALAEKLIPGCKAEIHSVPAGKTDPLFDPIAAGIAKPDPQIALAAVNGSIGPNLNAVIDANRTAFDKLNQVLNGSGKAPVSIFDQPMSLVAGTAGVTLNGPLSTASTFTENLLLEYTDGMDGNRFGWGRLDATGLQQIMALHTTYANLVRRTPYLARVRGSNLLSHILRSMEQAASGKPVKGSIGTPGNTLVVLSGHDTNISNLSGLLNLSWTLPSYQPDDSPPGGALIFSLWKEAGSNQQYVRLQIAAQTLDQMHSAVPLSLKNPPAIADVFIPACGTAREGFICEWSAFQRAVLSAIDPQFVE